MCLFPRQQAGKVVALLLHSQGLGVGGGERAKTNYCDCLPYDLLTPLFQLPGKEEEKGVRGRGKRWFIEAKRAG